MPPSDPAALRAAIERSAATPTRPKRMGKAAREFIEEQASLDHFVERIVEAVRAGHAGRSVA